MDVIAIYCKGCDALYYANSCPHVEDIPDIVNCALRGDRVEIVDTEEVKVKLETCKCPDEIDAAEWQEPAWIYRAKVGELQDRLLQLGGQFNEQATRACHAEEEVERLESLYQIRRELREACARAHLYLCQVSPMLDGLEPESGCGGIVTMLEAAMDQTK